VVPLESLEILSQVKRELINTIRQVVEVVSKYAGGALPEQARNSVRSFILMLPERWSLAARADADASLRGNGPLANGRGVSGGVAMAASTRVLTLATESLDMMRSVTGVFKESLDRAEAWVDRYVPGCLLVNVNASLSIPRSIVLAFNNSAYSVSSSSADPHFRR
jgi:hypothetical protein